MFQEAKDLKVSWPDQELGRCSDMVEQGKPSLRMQIYSPVGGPCCRESFPQKRSLRGFIFQTADIKCWLEFGNLEGSEKDSLFGVGGLEPSPGP